MTTPRETSTRRLEPWQAPEFFRAFVERSEDLMTVVDTEARFVYVNPAAGRMFGLAPDDCLGRCAFDSVHPEDRDRTRAEFATWIRSGEGPVCFLHENRQLSGSGEVTHLLWTIQRIRDRSGRTRYLASMARDVTRARRLEELVARSAKRLGSLIEGMLDPVITIDQRGHILQVSRSVGDVFGYAPEELVGQKIQVLMPEPHRSHHDEYLARYLATGETWILNTTRQFEVLRKDGAPITCELSVSRIDVPGEEEPIFCGSFRDVTQRLRAERELAESERRFHAIFDQEYQLVGLLDPAGTVLEANQAALQAAGLSREDVVGHPFWETRWWRHSTQDRERLRGAIERAAAGEFVRFETTVTDPSGASVAIDFSIKPILDAEGRVVLLLPEGRNVTPIKEAQRRETAMLRALAAIGESASVLAHEIKNPITGINIALRAVADRLGADHQELLEDLVSRMQRLEQTMRRTLSFARPLDLRPARCGAGELARGAAVTLQPLAESRGVRLEVEERGATPPLEVDPGLIEEVLVNLVRNGIEAVPAGGRVRLSSGPDGGGGAVLLEVEDDGPGIPASQLPQLFKPFVTTKAEGTGLGLAVCKKIVEAHGGTIDAGRSELGGARFRVRLPVPLEPSSVADPAGAAVPAAAPPAPSAAPGVRPLP